MAGIASNPHQPFLLHFSTPFTPHAAMSDTAPARDPAGNAPSAPGLQAAHRTRALALTCCIALIVLCVLWEGVLAPLHAGSWWLAAKALPLLIALPGLVRMRMYTYRWLSLAVWLYFTEGVVRAVDAPPARYLALAEVALAMGLFAACVAHVRLRQKWAKVSAASAETA